MELQRRVKDLEAQGIGLAVVTYDSPETLRKFADGYGITYPLIADVGSPIITAYGLLNTTVEPGGIAASAASSAKPRRTR